MSACPTNDHHSPTTRESFALTRNPRAAWTTLLLAPIPAVLLGAFVMRRANVPAAVWGLHLAAAALGVALSLATRQYVRALHRPVRAPHLIVLAAVALLGATFLHDGIEQVHRWIAVGSVQLHVGAIVLPLLLVMLNRLDRAWSAAAALVVLCILWRQPDAAQSTAFALAWSIAEWSARGKNATVPIAIAMALAAVTTLRPDPLLPVAHVEGIVSLAAQVGVGWGAASIVALLLPPIAWLAVGARDRGAPIAAYIAVTLAAAWFGDFPVPYLGYGVSPIVGYYLAVAASFEHERFASN